jgi:hypothetical protein
MLLTGLAMLYRPGQVHPLFRASSPDRLPFHRAQSTSPRPAKAGNRGLKIEDEEEKEEEDDRHPGFRHELSPKGALTRSP